MVKCKYCGKSFDSKIGLGIHKRSCSGWINELNLTYAKPAEFKCECGKIFDKRQSLITHGRFCDRYKSCRVTMIQSPRKINNSKYQCECGKIFSNYQSLNAHMSHCDYHHEKIGTKRKLRPSEINQTNNWENKSPIEIEEIHKRSGKTYSDKIRSGDIIPSFKGKHHTEDSKEKIRLSTIDYINKTKGGFKTRYSIKACNYINRLNKERNWNLQHAENGGEISIGGYFVDGYDKELNIVFEYDESRHYIDVNNNVLCKRDIERQEFIINKLSCEFWRYNEKLDLLYKVI